MIRYILAALALKIFSISDLTINAYRRLGNIFGCRIRAKADIGHYIDRGDMLASLCDKHGIIQKDGCIALELGTGWLHWYSVYLNLRYDLYRTDMMDVWDNRQFDAMRDVYRRLLSHLRSVGSPGLLKMKILQKLSSVENPEDIYTLLRLHYIIDKEGVLRSFPPESYDLIFSFHTLEHVDERKIPTLLKNVHRALKPGGYCIHQIGIDDHLAHYSRSVSGKEYLKYSDNAWNLFFGNRVQYFNRIQAPGWLCLLGSSGFECLDVVKEPGPELNFKVDRKYEKMSSEDLKCVTLTVVCRKRAASACAM